MTLVVREKVITDSVQISRDALTSILRAQGALLTGSVVNLDIAPLHADNSRILRLRLAYSGDAIGACPQHLFLKMVSDAMFGISEVDYYARDYIDLPGAPIPVCYDAAYSSAHGSYHVLLEDLSATHRNNWETEPTLEYGLAVAEALARLHAHYWGASGVKRGDGCIPDDNDIERYVAASRPGLEPMLVEATNVLDPETLAVLPDIFAHHPHLMYARAADASGFSIVHGDLNPGNILSPISKTENTRLIDRQPFDWSLTTWLGVSDLAYMMVHWWPTSVRRLTEWPILRHYHAKLGEYGVTEYAWSQLVRDYRLCAVQSVYVVTVRCVKQEERMAMRWVWLPQLQKTLTAFSDLNCRELWA